MSLSPEQIVNGFWYFQSEDNFPPPRVTYPDEYDSEGYLNLVCTQLSISGYQKRKLVKQWVNLLPQLQHVRYLWFNSRTNQAMFEAACQMPNLEGLYVKWGSISDLQPLTQTPTLKFLHICAPGVTDISILENCKQLVVLELENFKRIRDLGPLSVLLKLEGLSVSGTMWTTHVVQSLSPLRHLTSLLYLHLINLKTLDGTLEPLRHLKSLITLKTGYNWQVSDFKMLRESLPRLKYGSPFQEDLIERFGKQSFK